MFQISDSAKRFIESIGVLSILCLGLLLYRVFVTDSLRYWFIPENLFLAWLGLVFGYILAKSLATSSWNSKKNIGLSALWLFFLPNTWYVVTDFIHVSATGEISVLYDIVLLITLSMIGIILGCVSLWLIHMELLKRIKNEAKTYYVVEAIILGSSFAIYLGRVLRWNSWDALTNPGGLLLNISDRVIDPLGHLHAVSFTGLFFVFLSGLYFAFYRGVQAVSTTKS